MILVFHRIFFCYSHSVAVPITWYPYYSQGLLFVCLIALLAVIARAHPLIVLCFQRAFVCICCYLLGVHVLCVVLCGSCAPLFLNNIISIGLCPYQSCRVSSFCLQLIAILVCVMFMLVVALLFLVCFCYALRLVIFGFVGVLIPVCVIFRLFNHVRWSIFFRFSSLFNFSVVFHSFISRLSHNIIHVLILRVSPEIYYDYCYSVCFSQLTYFVVLFIYLSFSHSLSAARAALQTRSGNYGSPNARRRVYVLATYQQSDASQLAMACQCFLGMAEDHVQTTLQGCRQHLEKLGFQQSFPKRSQDWTNIGT